MSLGNNRCDDQRCLPHSYRSTEVAVPDSRACCRLFFVWVQSIRMQRLKALLLPEEEERFQGENEVLASGTASDTAPDSPRDPNPIDRGEGPSSTMIQITLLLIHLFSTPLSLSLHVSTMSLSVSTIEPISLGPVSQ